MHIEHIMPQLIDTKTYSSWKDYLGIDSETYKLHRNLIGNLTLLEKKPNIQASNKPFEEKKKHYKESDFVMTRDLLKESDWRIEQINERCEKLAKIAVKIWRFN